MSTSVDRDTRRWMGLVLCGAGDRFDDRFVAAVCDAGIWDLHDGRS